MLLSSFSSDPAAYARLAALHPVGRIGTPGEVAEFVAFLAGEGAGFITGSALAIDGGIGGRLQDPL